MTFVVIVEFFLFILLCLGKSSESITDREYASMPDVFHLDDFDKCMLYGEDSLYCTITFQLYPANPENSSDIWRIIQAVSSNPRNYRHDKLRHGICVQTTCPAMSSPRISAENQNFTQELTQCYNRKFDHMSLRGEIIEMNCQSRESPYPVDKYDIAFAIFVLIYVIIVLVASLYEGISRSYRPKEEYDAMASTIHGKIISAFSIPKNWHRLATINTYNPDLKALRVIQGIRFYNMLCVILAHTILANLGVPVANTLYPENMTKKMMNMFFANGTFITQTFFLISGWLLTYNFLVYFENKEKIPLTALVVAFVKRYLRLTPVLALVIGFHSTWLVHCGRGPVWDLLVGKEHRRCRKNWWTNLLYLNTYIDRENMCTQPSWYLSTDIQLFVVSMALIWLIKRYEYRAKLIMGLSVFIGLVIPFLVVYFNKYSMILALYIESTRSFFMDVPEWHVMSTSLVPNFIYYMIGIIFGYLFYKTRDQKLVIKKYHHVLWWLATLIPCIVLILVNGVLYQADNYTPLESALYWAFSRAIFATSVGILIFGLTRNLGGVIRWLCEWTPAIYLGRLTYSVYIVHVGILYIKMGKTRTVHYVSDGTLIQSFFSDAVISILIGSLVTLLVEFPLVELLNLVSFGTESDKREEDSKITNNICSLHTWYLGVDIQFFAIGLLLLFLTRTNHQRLKTVLKSVTLVQILLFFAVIYWNDWTALVQPYPETAYLFKFGTMPLYHFLTSSFLANLSGYTAGMGYGYLYYRSRKNPWNPGKLVTVLWWISVWTFCLGVFIIPGVYIFSPDYQHNRLLEAIYGSTGRLIFTSSLGLGIYGLTQGIGGPMLWTCNWRPVVILSRLSYSAYLIHVGLCLARIGIIRRPVYLSDFNLFVDYFSDVSCTLLVALLITLFVEFPLSELQKGFSRTAIQDSPDLIQQQQQQKQQKKTN